MFVQPGAEIVRLNQLEELNVANLPNPDGGTIGAAVSFRGYLMSLGCIVCSVSRRPNGIGIGLSRFRFNGLNVTVLQAPLYQAVARTGSPGIVLPNCDVPYERLIPRKTDYARCSAESD